MLILKANDILKALPMVKAIAAMRQAFIAYSEDRAIMPLRNSLALPEHNGRYLVMPSSAVGCEVLSAKAISLYNGNPIKGLPNIQGAIIVFEASTGKPLALLEASTLTALRTGAASGLATNILANPAAKTAAIFGSGPQAWAQLQAIYEVRELSEAKIYSPNLSHTQDFVDKFKLNRDTLCKIRLVDSPAEALDGADIICTATNSKVPVFEDKYLKPGAHINAIGSYLPDVQEIPPQTMARAAVFTDSVEHALEETGDFIIPILEGIFTKNHIKGELGNLLDGRLNGRTGPDQITLFKSVGLAIQDTYAAQMALHEALKFGIGQVVDW
jgi:ornithine cyclodeaminase/alanine dehydrogenase-like protein (mu-crystallin family)